MPVQIKTSRQRRRGVSARLLDSRGEVVVPEAGSANPHQIRPGVNANRPPTVDDAPHVVLFPENRLRGRTVYPLPAVVGPVSPEAVSLVHAARYVEPARAVVDVGVSTIHLVVHVRGANKRLQHHISGDGEGHFVREERGFRVVRGVGVEARTRAEGGLCCGFRRRAFERTRRSRPPR